MKKTTPISKIMTKNVVTLNIVDSLETAEKLFKEHKIRHIPIVKNKEVIGMLSYSDLLRISYSEVSEDEQNVETFMYDMYTIKQVMAKNPYMVPPYTSVKDVAELLSKKKFHALPVVEDNELVGIVTSKDLINFLVEQL
jgi:CBS domain-containing membrane protein